MSIVFVRTRWVPAIVISASTWFYQNQLSKLIRKYSHDILPPNLDHPHHARATPPTWDWDLKDEWVAGKNIIMFKFINEIKQEIIRLTNTNAQICSEIRGNTAIKHSPAWQYFPSNALLSPPSFYGVFCRQVSNDLMCVDDKWLTWSLR